jgi:hypothetical protein
VLLRRLRCRQLKPGGYGLVRGASPPDCHGAGALRWGLIRRVGEAAVNDYGVAVARPQG